MTAVNLIQIILARIRTILGAIQHLTVTLLKFVWAFVLKVIAPRVSKWSADDWLFFFFKVGLFVTAATYMILFFWRHIQTIFAAPTH